MFSYIYFILNVYLQHILAIGDEGIDSRKVFVVVWGLLVIKIAFTDGEILEASLFLLPQSLPHNPEGMKQPNSPSYFQWIIFEIPSKKHILKNVERSPDRQSKILRFCPGMDTASGTNGTVPKRGGV